MAIKSVKLSSGRRGWRGPLRDVYDDLEEFEIYAESYWITKRLNVGLGKALTSQELWELNPVIEGSIDPRDLAISGVYENLEDTDENG